MTDMLDAEELYYELLRDAEERLGGDLSDAADEALAAAATAQAEDHNSRLCTHCRRLQANPVSNKTCENCQRASSAATAKAELAELEPQLEALTARRDELLSVLNR